MKLRESFDQPHLVKLMGEPLSGRAAVL
jgi:hypothetical protein